MKTIQELEKKKAAIEAEIADEKKRCVEQFMQMFFELDGPTQREVLKALNPPTVSVITERKLCTSCQGEGGYSSGDHGYGSWSQCGACHGIGTIDG